MMTKNTQTLKVISLVLTLIFCVSQTGYAEQSFYSQTLSSPQTVSLTFLHEQFGLSEVKRDRKRILAGWGSMKKITRILELKRQIDIALNEEGRKKIDLYQNVTNDNTLNRIIEKEPEELLGTKDKTLKDLITAILDRRISHIPPRQIAEYIRNEIRTTFFEEEYSKLEISTYLGTFQTRIKRIIEEGAKIHPEEASKFLKGLARLRAEIVSTPKVRRLVQTLLAEGQFSFEDLKKASGVWEGALDRFLDEDNPQGTKGMTRNKIYEGYKILLLKKELRQQRKEELLRLFDHAIEEEGFTLTDLGTAMGLGKDTIREFRKNPDEVTSGILKGALKAFLDQDDPQGADSVSQNDTESERSYSQLLKKMNTGYQTLLLEKRLWEIRRKQLASLLDQTIDQEGFIPADIEAVSGVSDSGIHLLRENPEKVRPETAEKLFKGLHELRTTQVAPNKRGKAAVKALHEIAQIANLKPDDLRKKFRVRKHTRFSKPLFKKVWEEEYSNSLIQTYIFNFYVALKLSFFLSEQLSKFYANRIFDHANLYSVTSFNTIRSVANEVAFQAIIRYTDPDFVSEIGDQTVFEYVYPFIEQAILEHLHSVDPFTERIKITDAEILRMGYHQRLGITESGVKDLKRTIWNAFWGNNMNLDPYMILPPIFFPGISDSDKKVWTLKQALTLTERKIFILGLSLGLPASMIRNLMGFESSSEVDASEIEKTLEKIKHKLWNHPAQQHELLPESELLKIAKFLNAA